MSESAIREAIFNALDAVALVGIVHDYERHAAQWDDFLNLFKTEIEQQEQIRGWMIGYRGVVRADRETFRPGSKTGISRIHRFRIIGIMGIDDKNESEKTFAALAEDVCDALDDDDTLHGATYLHASPAIMNFDPAPFAGILVHAVVIIFEVTEAI